MALLAATLRSGPERLTLLFKECVCGLAGDEEYWRVLVFCFFKSSHFSLFLLPPSPRPGSAECCCVHLVGGGPLCAQGCVGRGPPPPHGHEPTLCLGLKARCLHVCLGSRSVGHAQP